MAPLSPLPVAHQRGPIAPKQWSAKGNLGRTLLACNAQFLLSVVEGSGEGGVVFCDLPTIPPGLMGKFITTTTAAAAELEAGLASQRTKDALKPAKDQGVKLGNPRLVAGSPVQARAAAAAKRACPPPAAGAPGARPPCCGWSGPHQRPEQTRQEHRPMQRGHATVAAERHDGDEPAVGLYQRDFRAWALEQARVLHQAGESRVHGDAEAFREAAAALDYANLSEELASLGRSESR
jgi:hypothetical protein